MSATSADRFGQTCWFCGQPVKRGKGVNKHHVIPSRYHVPTKIRLAHESCHKRAHLELDDSRWTLEQFMNHMLPIDFGENIYADEPRPRPTLRRAQGERHPQEPIRAGD